MAALVAAVTPPHAATAGAGEGEQVAVVALLGHQGGVEAGVGPAVEEVVVHTAGVSSTGALPLLAGVGGETERLTAVVLGVPQSSLLAAVVLPTDQTLTTVNICLTVALPSLAQPHTVPHTAVLPTPTLHLQQLHLLGVHHDGQGRLPRGGVLQEGELEEGFKKRKKKISGMLHVVIREKTHIPSVIKRREKNYKIFFFQIFLKPPLAS